MSTQLINEIKMSRKVNPQRRELRRGQILAAAAQVFAESGYTRATTRQIAETAGVSEGLLYTYFDSKESLLFAMLSILTQGTLDRLQQAGVDLPTILSLELAQTLERPRVANDLFAAVISEVLVNPDCRLQYRHQRMDVYMEHLRNLLDRRGDSPITDPQDINILTRSIVALFLGLGIMRLMGDPLLQPENPDIHGLVQGVSSFILKGIEFTS
jgi:AcrR family transcriptional regulator